MSENTENNNNIESTITAQVPEAGDDSCDLGRRRNGVRGKGRSMPSSLWSEEEDEMLRVAILVHRISNWERVAAKIPNKTAQQCKKRWNLLRPTSNSEVSERRKWSTEEDDRLTMLVMKYGTKNWRIIASHLRGRLPKQCRERWINHVDPVITKGRLSDDDWKIVIKAQREIGNRWSEIAKLLPGRTPNQIKNHWHAMMRKRANKRKYEETGIEDDYSEHDEILESPRKRMRIDESSSECLSPRKEETNLDILCQMAEVLYKMEVEPTSPNVPSLNFDYTISPPSTPDSLISPHSSPLSFTKDTSRNNLA